MPYSYPDNVPKVSKNWTGEEQRKCTEAANAVLREGGEDAEQNAIFACIRAAGKTQHPGGKATVKAVGDWELDVLGCPYGGPHEGKDSQGEFFAPDTNWNLDKGFPELPPVAYYHGWDETGKPKGTPEYLGKTIKRWVDDAGIWWKVQLDKTSEWAKRIWGAAQQGVARASTGSLHLSRVDDDGHIREWPVVELSLLDMNETRQPVNTYAIAVPAMKAMYQRAGLPLPDDIAQKAAQEAAQETVKVASAATAGQGEIKAKQDDTGENEMDEQQVKAVVSGAVTEAVAAALKADQERRDAEVKATADKAAQDKAIADEAVKAARAEWEETARVEGNRLRGKGIYIAKYGDTRRYDNLDVGEHALLIGMLMSGQFARPGNLPPTDAMVKAFALKVTSEAEKGEAANLANYALKAIPVKADEIMYSTLTTYGNEWVGVAYSQDLWEKIRIETFVLDRLMRDGRVVQIPQGFESGVIPYEGADPTWYKVAQATATETAESAGAYYRPAVTIPSSKFAAPQRTISVAKMGCRTLFSGEMTEDSLIAFVPQARKQIVESGAEMFEHAIINGDTTTTTLHNINDVTGTPAGTEVFMLVDGFRKLALVTNTANARSGGALTDDDYLDTAILMGTAGKNARDQRKVTFIPDANVYWKSLKLATVKTQDVWPNATLEEGQLARIWGYEVKPSWMMHYDEAGVSTALKATTTGYVDSTTLANNTTGSILGVRWDQWAIAWKRQITLETSRYPESDVNQIVAMARWGLTYRDTEASSISYNLSL